MCSAAELFGKFSHADNPDNITVLLSKKSSSTYLFCFFDRHIFCFYRQSVHDLLVNNPLYFFDLFFCKGGKMRKVKAQSVLIDRRSRLLHMGAKYRPQCLLQ